MQTCGNEEKPKNWANTPGVQWRSRGRKPTNITQLFLMYIDTIFYKNSPQLWTVDIEAGLPSEATRISGQLIPDQTWPTWGQKMLKVHLVRWPPQLGGSISVGIVVCYTTTDTMGFNILWMKNCVLTPHYAATLAITSCRTAKQFCRYSGSRWTADSCACGRYRPVLHLHLSMDTSNTPETLLQPSCRPTYARVKGFLGDERRGPEWNVWSCKVSSSLTHQSSPWQMPVVSESRESRLQGRRNGVEGIGTWCSLYLAGGHIGSMRH